MSPGHVRFLDHTADVGFDLAAPTLAGLFHEAALAMLALLRGDEEVAPAGGDRGRGEGASSSASPGPTRTLDLAAPDGPRLLADWLRELLFLHEVEGLDYQDAAFRHLGPQGSGWRVHGAIRLRVGGEAVREIKGVTYHEMALDQTPDGWSARVIFDV